MFRKLTSDPSLDSNVLIIYTADENVLPLATLISSISQPNDDMIENCGELRLAIQLMLESVKMAGGLRPPRCRIRQSRSTWVQGNVQKRRCLEDCQFNTVTYVHIAWTFRIATIT